MEGAIGRRRLVRKFDIASTSAIHRWTEQYRKYRTCVDGRGKNATGRPKGIGSINLEDMSKEELIEYIQIREDTKKSVAYLKMPDKNIYSPISTKE